MALLDTSYGFTSGNLNTGVAGNGWGINTSIFFQIEHDKEYILPHTGGLVIDLYSLVYMNPLEKIEFLIDTSMIDKAYIEVVQEANLIYLIPKTSKIIEDNYLSNLFLINVEIVGSNGSNGNTDITINYTMEPHSGPNNYKIIYNNLDYKIPLKCLLANSSDFTDIDLESLNIKYINGQLPNIYDVNYTSLISNGYFNTNEISTILNPEIDWEYSIGTDIYMGSLKFINFVQETTISTQISSIQSYITPISGDLFDVKDFVTGDTRNLKIIPVNEVLPLTSAFKVESVGHYISIIPNTKEFMKLQTSKIFIQKYAFESLTSRGVFDLYITADPIVLTDSILDSLIPSIKPVKFTLTNNKLEASYYDKFNGINLEPLITNRVFDLSDPNLTTINLMNGLDYKNLQLNKVNGLHLNEMLGGTAGIPDYVLFDFRYKDTIIPFEGNAITFIEDKILYEEPIEIAPISLLVTKNSSEIANIFNYIKAPKSYMDEMTLIDIDSTNLLNVTGTDIIMANPNLYRSSATLTGPEKKEILTEVTAVNNSIFTNVNNKDDFGNIIGMRKIPITLILDDINNNVETDITLILEPLKVRFIFDNLTGAIKLDLLNIIKNINIENITNGKSSIQDVLLDPITNIDINMTYNTTISDLTAMGSKPIGIVWNHNDIYLSGTLKSSTNLPASPKIGLNIRVQNSDGISKDYTQIINFI